MSTKDNSPSPDHPSCQKCSLFEGCVSPFMEGSGSKDPHILVIGEAPGADEDDIGVPFVGQSGQLLRETLDAYGIEEEDVRFTNVVRCRPPDNKIQKKHINHCKQFVLEEIEEYQPAVVLLMGNSPLNAILGETGITNWNGVLVDREEALYVPLFHPAYILRNEEAMSEWLDGFDKVFGEDEDTTQEDYGNWKYEYPLTIEEILEMRDALHKCKQFSFDTETTALDAYSKDAQVIAMSFGTKELKTAWSFPTHHPESHWTDQEIEIILDTIDDLFARADENGQIVVGHNLKFDHNHVRQAYGLHFQIGADTMLMSHLIDSNRGKHSLKRLAGLHLGMYDYDRPIEDYKRTHKEADPNRGGSYANIPLELLLPYACMDVHATAELNELLYNELSDLQKILHDQVITAASDVLAEIEHNGNKIDDHVATRYASIYGMKRRELLWLIYEQNPEVQQTQEYYQTQADLGVIADALNIKRSAVPKWKTETRKYLKYVEIDETHITFTQKFRDVTGSRSKKRQRDIIDFNPNSDFHLRTLLFKFIRLDKNKVSKTDTGLPSVAADELKQFGDNPIIEQIRLYKLYSKMLGTYLRPSMTSWKSSGDGLVRSTYNQHGARTGRLASTEPNLQNTPTPEKEPNTLLEILPIKNVFTSRFRKGIPVLHPLYDWIGDLTEYVPKHDGLIGHADYSGMELRCFASLSDCRPMLDIHKSGKDFHSMVTSMATGVSYDLMMTDEKKYKPLRYRFKWTNWTLLFGGDAYTLYRLYPESFATLDEAVDIQNMYFARFPEVPEYFDRCVEFVQAHGYIESAYGRREHLPYLASGYGEEGMIAKERRAAVNMPVQSTASDTLLIALSILHYEMKANKFRSLLINTVHDSMVFDFIREEVVELVRLAKDVMENVEDYANYYMPAVKFDWLKCPLSADAEIGTHYGAMVPYLEEEWK